MKSFKKRKKNNKKLHLSFIYLIIILFITIGFSSFSSNLSIDGEISFKTQKDIRISNITVTNNTNEATSNNEKYNVNSITSTVNLPNASSTITYLIEVKNKGNVEQGIYEIKEIYKNVNTNEDSNLEIKNNTINLKESLCDDDDPDQCSLGSTTTFEITIGYKENGYNSNNLEHSIELDFDFRRMFSITYVDFSGDTNNLPNKVIDGDNISINFDSTSGIPTSTIVTGGIGNYSNPNLIITDILDDIIITGTFENSGEAGYVYTINLETYVLHGNQILDTITLYDTPEAAMADYSNTPFCLKHHIINNIVEESFLLFVITPEMAEANPNYTAGTYILKGGINEVESASKPVYESNIEVLKQAFSEYEYNNNCADLTSADGVTCNGNLNVSVNQNGTVSIYTYVDGDINDTIFCAVDSDGDSNCWI